MLSKGRGNPTRGEKSYRAIVSEEDVFKIRKLGKMGIFCKDIAKIFGVSTTQISRIIAGTRWGWLTKVK
jgi:predicted transcriptional regulator